MIDIPKQIAYWRNSSEEDWQLGKHLVDEGHKRHGLFLLHLALEKVIKAHICKATNDIAPRGHNLVRLADNARLALVPDDRAFLATMSRYNIEGRYPDINGTPLPDSEISNIKKRK